MDDEPQVEPPRYTQAEKIRDLAQIIEIQRGQIALQNEHIELQREHIRRLKITLTQNGVKGF